MSLKDTSYIDFRQPMRFFVIFFKYFVCFYNETIYKKYINFKLKYYFHYNITLICSVENKIGLTYLLDLRPEPSLLLDIGLSLRFGLTFLKI